MIFQPQTRQALKQGIDTVANAVRPTLGPSARVVALENTMRTRSPELLDDGGTIARRLLQLPDRSSDVGAMLLRETLWRQKERYDDGTATTTILYQTVFDEGVRFITAGGNAMVLRRHLDKGLRLILSVLEQQTVTIETQEDIERLAYSLCGAMDIAEHLADIFDVLGAHGLIEVRDGGRDLHHEFYVGSYWDSKIPSNIVFDGQIGQRLELENTAWVISDFEFDDLTTLVTLVTDVYKAGYSSLVIMGKSFSEQAIAAQGANSRLPDFKLVYLEPTGLLDEQDASLEDLALITGGQVLRQITGHSASKITLEMLGTTELAWVDINRFGIITGSGDPEKVQQAVSTLENRFELVTDERIQEVTRTRLGRLRGGSAVMWCGGTTESEMRYQQDVVNRTTVAMRGALLDGALPGGGAALLKCIEPLQACNDACSDTNERAAYQILMNAVTSPLRALLSNTGDSSPGVIINDIQLDANRSLYDIQKQELVDIKEAGILDSATALLAAVRNGIGGAALTLTVDVIVHREKPPMAMNPDGEK